MATVIVSNISPHTSDHEVQEFFRFCGNIADFEIKPDGDSKTKTATLTFEKETAQRTAILLNHTQLGPNQLSVTTASELDEETGHPSTDTDDTHSDHISQEDKPRTRIFAEYLAHGYVIGDAALTRAIDLDQKHGVSHRFVSTLESLDTKYHARDHARAADENYHLKDRASSLFSGLSSFFEKATNSPTGRKLVQFYSSGSRQIQDIHAEALRLADLKKQAHGGSAYKAAGLEKVFGKEKHGATSETGAERPSPASPSVPSYSDQVPSYSDKAPSHSDQAPGYSDKADVKH